jgi:hypothetical protein
MHATNISSTHFLIVFLRFKRINDEDEDDWRWSYVDESVDTLFCDEAIAIHPSEPYHVMWPMLLGRLNTRDHSIAVRHQPSLSFEIHSQRKNML